MHFACLGVCYAIRRPQLQGSSWNIRARPSPPYKSNLASWSAPPSQSLGYSIRTGGFSSARKAARRQNNTGGCCLCIPTGAGAGMKYDQERFDQTSEGFLIR